MRLKKRFMVCALVVMLLSIIAETTLAYYTTSATAHNVITTSGIAITLQETVDSEGTPFVDLTGVMPGQEVAKIVAVRNDEEEAFVRIAVDVVIKDGTGKVMDLDEKTLSGLISMDYDKTNWKEKDGVWYYSKALATGEKTKPLFTKVIFDGPNMTNEYQNCSVEIHVDAQAVQVRNNPGTTALTAKGWPEIK